ncbi:MAG: hypothetical protein CMI52_03810 [Parcubacteria group bacterium]|nr:hypothetical protein [Parcubacteria group bacterium]
MKLRGVEFGSVLGASGVQGFFGEGFWFHKYARPFGLNFDGMTFVSKTTTLNERAGNIGEDWHFPKCIVVKHGKAIALNSVGLPGPGADALLRTDRWQRRTEPFLISFMSVLKIPEDRIGEFTQFCRLLAEHRNRFRTPFGLQINVSCPNAGLDTSHLTDEVKEYVCIANQHLDIPIMIKINATELVAVAKKMSLIDGCDAICVSNTIPWGKLPEKIDWKGLFGSDESPLAKYDFGNGGLSGAPLLPIVESWVKKARQSGITIPINAGGGILSPADAERLIHAGADSVFIGSMAFLRPWRVARTIRRINKLAERRVQSGYIRHHP